jgi:antitoxin VapB
MDTAKLFQNGQSQAVRLPKNYRLSGNEVYIKKVGNAIVLLPIEHPWETLFDSLEQFTDDFLEDRAQPIQQQIRENLFD